MDEIINQLTAIVPPKYAALLTTLFVASQVLGRIVQAIRTGGGLRSILSSIWLGTNKPKEQPEALPQQRPTGNVPAWIALGFLSLALTGCLVPRGQIKPGADPVVVQAEALAESAGDSMDAFVQWEYRNRAVAGSDATAMADLVREFGPQYIRDLKTFTRIYKTSRTPDNLNNTRAAILTLQSFLEQIRNYYTPPKGTP